MSGKLATLAAIALSGAGCGSSGSPQTGPAGGGAKDDARGKAVRFAECMRENGVSEFPDPDPSEGLTVDGVLNGSGLDPTSATWENAMATCEDLQPAGFTGDDEVTAEERDTRFAFAECMRENGVQDFPDPVDGEPLVNTYLIPSSNTSGGMTILDGAMEKCGDLAEKAAGQ